MWLLEPEKMDPIPLFQTKYLPENVAKDKFNSINPFVGIDAIVRQIIPCPVWQ